MTLTHNKILFNLQKGPIYREIGGTRDHYVKQNKLDGKTCTICLLSCMDLEGSGWEDKGSCEREKKESIGEGEEDMRESVVVLVA